MRTRGFLCIVGVLGVLAGCSPAHENTEPDPSPYLLVFAGDEDGAQEDFLAVIDVAPGSAGIGRVLATQPAGVKSSMPHHMEYELPPPGELLFMNAHHAEQTLLVDVSTPLKPKIVRRLTPPAPFRFTHDYKRLPNGNRLVGFLRSEGPSPKAGDQTMPGAQGGIAEYSAAGDLVRTASAAVDGLSEAVRPYAFAIPPTGDRFVTTSAPMMEDGSADVVQVWRYSDFKLLHTLAVPPGTRADGTALAGAARFPFEPRVMPDGSVLLNAYGCGFYRLTGITSDKPVLANVYTIQVPDPDKPDSTRGACGIPLLSTHFWIMAVGRAHAIVTLDISDPSHPREAARFDTAADFNPHWMAKDPASNRVVVGAEFGGEQGLLMLRLDEESGQLRLDDTIVAGSRRGYVDLSGSNWPHGASGPAWGHAALFLPAAR